MSEQYPDTSAKPRSMQVGGTRPPISPPIAAAPRQDAMASMVADDVSAMIAAAEAAGIGQDDPLGPFVRSLAALLGAQAENMAASRKSMTEIADKLSRAIVEAKGIADREVETTRERIGAIAAESAMPVGHRSRPSAVVVIASAVVVALVTLAALGGYWAGHGACQRDGVTRLAPDGQPYCTFWLD